MDKREGNRLHGIYIAPNKLIINFLNANNHGANWQTWSIWELQQSLLYIKALKVSLCLPQAKHGHLYK